MATDPDEKAQQEEPSSEIGDDPTEKIVETVECPNCGQRFVGDYCPGCGQKANPSASATDVLSGLLGEIIDVGSEFVESKFWQTFIGLTIRPGEMLHSYLEGTRTPLLNPGRYLVVAIVVELVTHQFLSWIGARSSQEPVPSKAIPEKEETLLFLDALSQDSAAYLDALAATTWFRVCVYLIIGLLGSLLLFRLFRNQLLDLGQGFALFSYVLGHSLWVSTIVTPIVLLFVDPAVESSSLELIVPICSFGYIAVALTAYFGFHWRSIGKSVLGGLLLFLEVILLVYVMICSFQVWLLGTQPGKYLSETAMSEGVHNFLFLLGDDALFQLPVQVALPPSIVLIPNALMWLSPVLIHIIFELYVYFTR